MPNAKHAKSTTNFFSRDLGELKDIHHINIQKKRNFYKMSFLDRLCITSQCLSAKDGCNHENNREQVLQIYDDELKNKKRHRKRRSHRLENVKPKVLKKGTPKKN